MGLSACGAWQLDRTLSHSVGINNRSLKRATSNLHRGVSEFMSRLPVIQKMWHGIKNCQKINKEIPNSRKQMQETEARVPRSFILSFWSDCVLCPPRLIIRRPEHIVTFAVLREWLRRSMPQHRHRDPDQGPRRVKG